MKNQSKVGFAPLPAYAHFVNALIHPVKELFLSSIQYFSFRQDCSKNLLDREKSFCFIPCTFA
jgi:hypothetical protein